MGRSGTESHADAQQLLVEQGVKPSFQRLRVLQFILGSHSHPSAEDIFQALKPEIPTLSRTTIYNTLNLLVDKGLLIPLTISEHETRYDIHSAQDHSHFFCRGCGRIIDIHQVSSCVAGQEIEGHLVQSVRLYLTGTCSRCRENEPDDSRATP